MTRFLPAAALLLLAACGPAGEPAAPEATDEAAAGAAAEAAPAEPAPSLVAEDPPAAAAASDGETVEAASATTSPVAAAVAASTPPPRNTAPLRWKEGEHYSVLPVAQPTDATPGVVEVVEIFWYGCGHCYALEPRLVAWERNKPDWMQLKRLPVVWNQATREDARLYYLIEALGKVDTLHGEVFRELHVNRRPLTVIVGNRVDTAATERAVRDFVLARGVSAEDFQRHYRSFATESKLRQAEGLARRYLADHTPMMVVQGKYTTDVSMAGGPETLFEIVDDLAERERGGG